MKSISRTDGRTDDRRTDGRTPEATTIAAPAGGRGAKKTDIVRTQGSFSFLNRDVKLPLDFAFFKLSLAVDQNDGPLQTEETLIKDCRFMYAYEQIVPGGVGDLLEQRSPVL